MDDNALEKESSEVATKIEVVDKRKEPDLIQQKEFETNLKKDKIEEKLIQFEGFVGKYAKSRVSKGLKATLVEGPAGNGQVKDGVLTVNLPSVEEIAQSSKVTPESKPYLDILVDAGATYEDLVFALSSSTVLHESEHMILDSRPGSQLEKDFKEYTGIEGDTGGNTLSLLDEGITYAFQMEKDSESVLFDKLRASKPQVEEKFTVETRKTLGQALRSKVKDYLDEGRQIDIVFLKFAGEEMNKLDMKKYATEAEQERLNRRIN